MTNMPGMQRSPPQMTNMPGMQHSPPIEPVTAEKMQRSSTTENPMRSSLGGSVNGDASGLYGKLQHEVRQRVRSSGRCCGHIDIDTLAQFYDSILLVKKSHQETACCCCSLPDGYEMMAVPKYKLRSVAIGKEGGDNCCVPMLILCPPRPNYIVTLGLSDEKAKTFWEMAGLQQTINLVVSTEPNSQFLFGYVYGPLCTQGQMKSMHMLSHMINDDLTAPLTPKGLSDLEAR